jgi:hypothetical protein
MMSAARQPEIDSRQYVFSYLIRSPVDVPGDFPIPEPERLRIGLFLPRDGPDWFGRRAYPPRILLLDGDAIVVLTHPRYDQPPVRVALPDLAFYEIGHFLLIGWLRLVTARSSIHLPYNTGSDRPVSEFLDSVLHEYLAGGIEGGNETVVSFGPALDIKFGNCLTAAMRPGERLCATWFSPPYQVSRRWGPFRVGTRVGGDLLACTDQRVLWITDRCNGRYELYGSVVSTSPVRGVTGVQCQRDGDKGVLTISLHSDVSWSIPIPSERYADAEGFAREVETGVVRETLSRRRSEAAQI